MAKEVEEIKVTGLPTENLQEQEYDLLAGLLEAAEYKDEPTPVEVRRNGKLLFVVHLMPLSEKDIAVCRKKATTYMTNPAGKSYPPIEKDSDPALYRSWKIYLATTEEDRAKIWGNKDLKAKLKAEKGIDVLQNVEMIDLLLKSGEKDALCDFIEELSGYGSDTISTEEFAKKLIEGSPLAYMVHKIWQNQHVRPAVFMGLCSNNDPFTDGERAFCFASEAVKEENGERPTNLSEMAKMLGAKK